MLSAALPPDQLRGTVKNDPVPSETCGRCGRFGEEREALHVRRKSLVMAAISHGALVIMVSWVVGLQVSKCSLMFVVSAWRPGQPLQPHHLGKAFEKACHA